MTDQGERGPQGERGERGRRGAGIEGRPWRKDLITLALVVILMVAVFSWTNAVHQAESSRAGCERNNDRADVLYDFLKGASKARFADYLRSDNHDDLVAYRTYQRLVGRMEQAVVGSELEPGEAVQVDCTAEFPKPWPAS